MSRYQVLVPTDAPVWARRMQAPINDSFNRIALWQDASRRYELNFVRDLGGNNSGKKDVTASLADAIEVAAEEEAQLVIPGGRYLIAYAGANAGGVEQIIRKSLWVTCSVGATFFTDEGGLDNDYIRIIVPADGDGLPEGGIECRWHGGYFDQSEQRGSTTMPFLAEYPVRKQGASATCDALSIRGSYTDGVEKNGFRLIDVSGITCNAGTHWESAGGDSGFFADGFDLLSISKSRFIGNRDQGIYISGGNAGATGYAVIEKNSATNCFGAFAAKRSLVGGSIRSNSSKNCVLGVFLGHIVGDGISAFSVDGNFNEASQVEIRADYCSNVAIVNNRGKNFGAMREDGTTKVDAYIPTALQLDGITYCDIDNNSTVGVNPTYIASQPWYLTLEKYDTGSVLSQYNRVTNNRSKEFRSIGGERVGEADNNYFDANFEFSGVAANIQLGGTNSWVRRFDWTLMRPVHTHPVLFQDGTSSAPMIARQGDPTSGIYFDTSSIGLARLRLIRYANTGYTAAGATQATATALLHDFNRVSVVGAGTGVRLPAGEPGMMLVVDNAGANALNVYPSVGARIDALAIDAPLVLVSGAWVVMYCGFNARWKSK